MTVKVSDRNSKLEVLYVASKLYDECISLSLREFGIRSSSSPLRNKYKQLIGSESDLTIVDDVIREMSLSILNLSKSIVDLIDGANSIYPRFKIEYETRLELQNKAIATCSMLRTELSNVIHFLDVDIESFKSVNILLEKLQHLLVEWRKYDRRKYKEINGYIL